MSQKKISEGTESITLTPTTIASLIGGRPTNSLTRYSARPRNDRQPAGTAACFFSFLIFTLAANRSFHGFLKCPRCIHLGQVSTKFRRGMEVLQRIAALGDPRSALFNQFGSQFVFAQAFLDRPSAKGLPA